MNQQYMSYRPKVCCMCLLALILLAVLGALVMHQAALPGTVFRSSFDTGATTRLFAVLPLAHSGDSGSR